MSCWTFDLPLQHRLAGCKSLPVVNVRALAEHMKTKSVRIACMYGMVTLNEFRLQQVPEHLRPLAASIQREADITFAAAELARLPRRTKAKRVYTGRLFFGRRARVGMRVLLPNGQTAELRRVVRGIATVSWHDEQSLRPTQYGALDIAELRKLRHPAATLLGGLKLGITERASRKKAEAARRNGRCPVRPGSRPRGRPKSPANGSILSP